MLSINHIALAGPSSEPSFITIAIIDLLQAIDPLKEIQVLLLLYYARPV